MYGYSAGPLVGVAAESRALHSPIPMMTPEHARWVFKLVVLAVTAAAALIGAVLVAVPSGDSGVRLCLNVAQCLQF